MRTISDKKYLKYHLCILCVSVMCLFPFSCFSLCSRESFYLVIDLLCFLWTSCGYGVQDEWFRPLVTDIDGIGLLHRAKRSVESELSVPVTTSKLQLYYCFYILTFVMELTPVGDLHCQIGTELRQLC